jgi:hypothetical protein
MNWIPIHDDAPEDGERVLITTRNANGTSVWWHATYLDGHFRPNDAVWATYHNVTHWARVVDAYGEPEPIGDVVDRVIADLKKRDLVNLDAVLDDLEQRGATDG